MKKNSSTLALLIALCLVVSMLAGCSIDIAIDDVPASEPAASSGEAFAQVDDTHWAGGSVTIEKVEYAPEFTDAGYVDATLFTSISKIVTDSGDIVVDNTLYTPILTVDGVQVDLYNIAEAKTFVGDCVITLVEKGDFNSNSGAPFGADKAQSSFGPFYYTAAIYISEGAYDTGKSVTAAQQDGEVTDTAVNGLVLDSEGDYFSAIYVVDSDYAINDANIKLVGSGGDDFNGWGAGIVALGAANVELNRSTIYSTGVLRSALFTSGTAQVSVNDSVIITENDETAVPYDTTDNYATPMMQQCPLALGIEGNIRATIACGSGCNMFTNSLVVSNGWAVLSTDSGKSGATALIANAMVAVVGYASDAEPEDGYDFTYEVNGTPWYVTVSRLGETSGYIAYADSGVLDYAYGCAWYSPDYLGILTSGLLSLTDNCYGYSGRIGFLLHSGGGGSGTGNLVVSDSSFDIQDIFALTQSQGSYVSNITLDNVDIAMANSGRDILFAQIDTDDHAGGPGETSNTITDLTYDEYLATAAATSEKVSTISIANSHVQGNIYNADTLGIGLDVTLDAAEVDGAISSAWSYHLDADGNPMDGTEFVMDSFTGTRDGSSGTWDYTLFCRVDCQPAPTRANPVSLTMTNGSVWMVTGDNYLSYLRFDDTCQIQGMSLTMTVDGVETELVAGTYTGEIVLSAGAAPSRGEGDAEIKAPVLGEAAQVEASTAEAEAAFEAELTIEPFNVDVGGDMVLEFSAVQYAFGDGTVTIYIPDSAKQIDCVIAGGEWVFGEADFVDLAIIDTAKALYEAQGDAAPAAAPAAASAGAYPKLDEYKAYLLETLLQDSFWQSNEDTLRADLDAADSPDAESIQHFTGSGEVDQAPEGVVFPMTYDAWIAVNG